MTTTARLRLNPVTEPDEHADVTTILLGHYLDWFFDEIPDVEAGAGIDREFLTIRRTREFRTQVD